MKVVFNNCEFDINLLNLTPNTLYKRYCKPELVYLYLGFEDDRYKFIVFRNSSVVQYEESIPDRTNVWFMKYTGKIELTNS